MRDRLSAYKEACQQYKASISGGSYTGDPKLQEQRGATATDDRFLTNWVVGRSTRRARRWSAIRAASRDGYGWFASDGSQRPSRRRRRDSETYAACANET
jgi:hypothetical protein